jgi:hypothetical protein
MSETLITNGEVLDTFATHSTHSYRDDCSECVKNVKEFDEDEEEIECDHMCSGNCRRVGCNCNCGEWHKE